MIEASYREVVVQAIRNLGVDPALCADPTGELWNLKKGSANIDIRLFVHETNGKVYCLVSAWVAHIAEPTKTVFYEELLELNGKYVGVSFCKIGNEIFVISDREAQGMDADELTAMIHRISNVADHYDDLFKAKYPL